MSAPNQQGPALAGAREESSNLSTPDFKSNSYRRQRAQAESPLLNVPPPHSEQAERGALGCILLAVDQGEADRIKEMIPKLRIQDFYDLRLREVWTAISVLHRDGELPSSLKVIQWLSDKGRIEQAGGRAEIAGLPESAPVVSLFESHFQTLKDKSLRRQLIDASARLSRMATDEAYDSLALAHDAKASIAGLITSGSERKEHFRFYTPSECGSYTPFSNLVLVGNYHITRGATALIAGPPGVGKSRTATALAIAGAAGCGNWFGLPVHRQFRTLILQNENGLHRLKDEFAGLNSSALDDYIRISEPPPLGVRFDDDGFCNALAEYLETFAADVIILDPWNSTVADDKQRDYAETFRRIKATLPKGENSPALAIVAHTKKPGDNKRSGRSLMFDVSGSHMIASVPRSIFVLQPASDDPSDDRVVWTNSKNNDGELSPRTAWHRRNGGFAPCENFDWKAFDEPDDKRRTITADDMRQVFRDGNSLLAVKAAADALRDLTGLGRTACYEAVNPKGRFGANLTEQGGLLSWKD